MSLRSGVDPAQLGRYTFLMRNFELTVVLPQKATPAKRKSILAGVSQLINEAGGKEVNAKELGNRQLAYKIKKEDSGFFVFFNLELEGLGAKNLAEKLRVREDIIRYLLVKNEIRN